jgi:hypothetical protein
MKSQQQLSPRERYRLVVSLLIIPLGLIISIRAAMFGIQAWTLILLGLAFVGLGIVRVRAFTQNQRLLPSRRKRA